MSKKEVIKSIRELSQQVMPVEAQLSYLVPKQEMKHIQNRIGIF